MRKQIGLASIAGRPNTGSKPMTIRLRAQLGYSRGFT